MIRLCDESTLATLLEYCEGDPFGCRIYAAAKAYDTDKPFAQFWLVYAEREDGTDGEITAAISKLDDGMTICAKGEYDHEEVDTFVSMMNGAVLALRPARAGEAATGVVMRLDREKMGEAASGECEFNPNAGDLYAVVEECTGVGFEIPSFEAFYGDMRYRERAGTVVSAIVRKDELPAACAAMHLSESTAMLTLCASSPDVRGQGYGACAVRSLLAKISDRDVYVMCLAGLVEYYEMMGFVPVGGFVY